MKRNGNISKLPIVVIDSTFLDQIYEIKGPLITNFFMHASKLFDFKTSEKKWQYFRDSTKYKNSNLEKHIAIIKIATKNIHKLEEEIFNQSQNARKIKANTSEDLWYEDLTLPYLFSKTGTKTVIFVSDNSGLIQICKDLNLGCICMDSNKFWAYLRYKMRRYFGTFYDMWV